MPVTSGAASPVATNPHQNQGAKSPWVSSLNANCCPSVPAPKEARNTYTHAPSARTATRSARLATSATAHVSSGIPPPALIHGSRAATPPAIPAAKPHAPRAVENPESTKSTGRYVLSHSGTYHRPPGTAHAAESRNPV